MSTKRKTTEEFIEEARKIHGDKYNYSKVEYVNYQTKVTIICPIHGEFTQTPTGHIKGNGCPMCANDRTSLRMTTEEFIQKSRAIHGNKYDYSNVEYTHNNVEVCIICPEHGEFLQKPRLHLSGCGCPICTGTARRTSRRRDRTPSPGCSWCGCRPQSRI